MGSDTARAGPIDPALLPHIFEPLRQGRRTSGIGAVAAQAQQI